MELYASMRLTLDCRIAAKLPTIMVASATAHIMGIQRSEIDRNAPTNTRIRIAKAGALGPVERNAATGAGAPWYTSGAQPWNGAAEILNAKPTKINAAATPTSPAGAPPANPSARWISERL